ncbi:MAG: DUF6491 family protein [Steroidobacteraceae bacterium]
MSRSKILLRGTCVLVAAALLASCASTPVVRSDAAERASFMANAGRPVERFEWVTGYQRWTAISPDQVVVWTNLNRAYLVTVSHPCDNLWFAHTIGFTRTGDSTYAHVNFVKADGWTCAIKTIQPVDYRGVQRDLRQASNQ